MDQYIKHLMFLVDEYHLKYKKQTFVGKPCGSYITRTYSFYNDTGCFTIHHLAMRDDLDFYFSSNFSNNYDDLREKLVNIWIDEPEVWNRHQKWILGLKDPFFWWKEEKVIKALAETIMVKIRKNNEFFGVQIQ